VVEAVDDGSCWVEVGASCYEGLAISLTLLGVDFEVDGPAELAAALEKLAGRLGRAVTTAEAQRR
jgi:hypothetical protein